MLNSLVIIPCRKNSKRIKNKNKIQFGNDRLFERTIKLAKKLKIKKKIFLDSDDIFYEKFAKSYKINFNLRPKKLASSKSKSIDFVINLINKLEKKNEKFDNVILLQTTSPFRNIEHVEKAYDLFKRNKLDSIVSACYVTFKNDQVIFSNIKKKINQKTILKNKNKILLINGAIYIAKIDFLKKYKIFFGLKKSKYYIMKKSLSIDLDTKFDLYLAKKMLDNEKKLNEFDVHGN